MGDRAAPALIEEMRAEKNKKVDPVGKMVNAVLERDQQLRRVGTRRCAGGEKREKEREGGCFDLLMMRLSKTFHRPSCRVPLHTSHAMFA